MSSKRYTEDFKVEAVRQMTEKGYPVKDLAKRLGVLPHSLYQCMKAHRKPPAQRAEAHSLSVGNQRYTCGGAGPVLPAGIRLVDAAAH